MVQTVLAGHVRRHHHALPGIRDTRQRQQQRYQLLLTVLHHDTVVTVHQVIPAARQAARERHRLRVYLFHPRRAEPVREVQRQRRVVCSRPAFMLHAHLYQRHRRVVQSHRHRRRVILQITGAPGQGHPFPLVVFIHQLPAQLRVRRQIRLRAQVKPVRRTLIVIFHLRQHRLVPVRQTQVAVRRQLQVVTPRFHPDAGPAVMPGHVIVIERVHPDHPVRSEVTHAQPQVGGGAVAVATHPQLGVKQV